MTDNLFNRVPLTEGTWAIICLATPMADADLPPGFDPSADDGREPALGTHSGFASREDAVRFARTINPAWRPVVARLETL